MSMPDDERKIFDLACDVINLYEVMKGYGSVDDDYIQSAYKDAMLLANTLQAKEDKRKDNNKRS